MAYIILHSVARFPYLWSDRRRHLVRADVWLFRRRVDDDGILGSVLLEEALHLSPIFRGSFPITIPARLVFVGLPQGAHDAEAYGQEEERVEEAEEDHESEHLGDDAQFG